MDTVVGVEREVHLVFPCQPTKIGSFEQLSHGGSLGLVDLHAFHDNLSDLRGELGSELVFS
jgi:hypothetical protein